MRNKEKFVRDILAKCGITVNGSNSWDIQVHDSRLYGRVLKEQNLGLGEAYMEGWWDCERIDQFIYRILRHRVDRWIKGNFWLTLSLFTGMVRNQQTRKKVCKLVNHHYDLDNDLFMAFLDPHNQYSCGYFKNTEDLNQAQEDKLELICKKLQLSPEDHLLDIGCGWGGLAWYASKKYRCRVTAINISEKQLQYAAKLCQGLPVRTINQDYRDIKGQYDKIVSVGMFEHVGYKNYCWFMRTMHRCLKDNGVALLHSIGTNKSTPTCDPWISKYIFPYSMIPGIVHMGKAIEGWFVMEDWHNFGPYYDKTLMAWNQNFQRAWPRLQARYDRRFKRMWEYYLLSCAGAFRARELQLW
jgi:cyclopropane-fatty-acyl-phospholipid synthase